MPERKLPIYWNLVPKPESEEATYIFMIANSSKTELTAIADKLLNKMLPADVKKIEGKIDSLLYKILVIDTFNSKIDIQSIAKAYNGKLIQDKNLYEGKKSGDRLEIYVNTLIESKLMKNKL